MRSTVDNCEVAYFAMKKWCSGSDGDILQLAAELENKEIGNGTFHAWTKSLKPIPLASMPEVSEPETQLFDLFFNDDEMLTDPLETVLQNFLDFLKLSPKPILLIANSANVDFFLLHQAILQTKTPDKFCGVISGFSEILPILKEKFATQINTSYFAIPIPVRDLLGQEEAGLSFEPRHNVKVIKQVSAKFVSKSDYIHTCKSYEEAFFNEIEALKRTEQAPVLAELEPSREKRDSVSDGNDSLRMQVDEDHCENDACKKEQDQGHHGSCPFGKEQDLGNNIKNDSTNCGTGQLKRKWALVDSGSDMESKKTA